MRLTLSLTPTLTLNQAISHSIITPIGECPSCYRKHNEDEIRQGWNDDPYDFTTECINCNTRFIAVLEVDGNENMLPIGQYDFLCPAQLYNAINCFLTDNDLSLEELEQDKELLLNEDPTLFWNLIRHNGTYTAGIEEFKIWKNKN